MGVTLHRIDEKLDHGEVLTRGEVPVMAGDDPASLMQRARAASTTKLVAEAVRGIAHENIVPISVNLGDSRPKTLPRRRDQRPHRLGRTIRHDAFRDAPLDEIPVREKRKPR